MPSLVSELRELEADERRRKRRRRARDEATPEKVRRVQEMQVAWPTLPARTKLLLVDAGITADSPVTEKIAQLGVKVLAAEKDRGRRIKQDAQGRERAVGFAAQAAAQQTGERELEFEQSHRDALVTFASSIESGRNEEGQRLFNAPELRKALGIKKGERGQAATYLREVALTGNREQVEEVYGAVSGVHSKIAGADDTGGGGGGIGQGPIRGVPGATAASQSPSYVAGTGAFKEGFEQAKGVLRGAGTAALAPGEFVTSQFRQGVERVREIAGGDLAPDMGTEGGGPADVTGAGSSVRATTAGQFAKALFDEGPADLGKGFFPDPDSPVGKAQAEAAREEGEMFGQAITPGRVVARGLVATGIVDPKDFWFNAASGSVDAMWAVSQIGDPTNLVLDSYTAGRRAAKTLALPSEAPAAEKAKRGVFANGVRGLMSPKTFDQALSGQEGAQLTEGLWKAKQANDFQYVRKTVGDSAVAVRILDAGSKDEIPDILRGATGLAPPERPPSIIPAVAGRETEAVPGGGFASPSELVTPRAEQVLPAQVPMSDPVLFEPPKLPGVGYKVQKSLDNVRLFHDMPRGAIDTHDVNRGVDEFDAVLRNAKVDSEMRDGLLADFARDVTYGGRPAVMAEGGAIRRGFEAIVENEVDRFSRTIRGRIGGEEAVGKFRDSQMAKHGKAFLDSYEDARVYMLDEIGDNAKLPWVMANGTREVAPEPSRFAEFLQRAIPVPDTREVRKMTSWMADFYVTPGVKQLVEGSTTALDFFYSQMFKPLALITRIAYPVRVIGEEQFRMAGAGYDSLFSGHPIAWLASAIGVRGKGATTSDDFARAAAESVLSGQPDEFSQAMSRGSGAIRMLDDPGDMAPGVRLKARMRYRAGEDRFGLSWAEELLKDSNDPIVRAIAPLSPGDAKEAFWSGDLSALRVKMIRNGGGWKNLGEREWSDQYIDFLYDHLKTFAPDDELLQAVVTGKIGDVPLVKAGKLGRGVGRPRINPDAARKLDQRVEAGTAVPWVPGDVVYRGSRRENLVKGWDNVVQAMFTGLMGYPTDKLSRGQVFKQAHWNRVAELLPYAKDETVASRWVAKAERMKLGKRQMAAVQRAAGRRAGEGRLSFAQIDTLAKAHGLDETKELLYDLSKRNQFFDTYRFIFPFGDAFKELATTWARLFRENPKAYYRFQQAITAGRETGFLHENQYGEEVFTYKGLDMLTEKLVGVPVPLEGPISGLNLIGQGYPGVGPGVQWAAVWGMPDKPMFDAVEEIIFPYGRPENQDPVSLLTDTLTPAWIEKITAVWGSPLGQDLRNRTIARMAGELRSTGDYGEGKEEHARLMSDAKKAADTFLIIQGLAQGVAPSTPLPEFQVFDRDGKTMAMGKVSEEYYNRRTKDGDDAAIGWLVQTFGKDARGILAGISSDLVFGLVDEKAAYDWERNNSGFMGKFPNVGGFFAPRSENPEDAFDVQVYGARQDKGQSIIPDPEVTSRVANDIFARWIYENEVEKADAKLEGDGRDAYLRAYREYLTDAYPGFQSDVGKVGKATVDERIEELERAVKDPTVKGTPAARMLNEYLAERNKVAKIAKNMDPSITNWWDAKATRNLVRYLGEYQTYLRDKYGRPANDMLDQVFWRDVAALEER